jgi:hypothetical protein
MKGLSLTGAVCGCGSTSLGRLRIGRRAVEGATTFGVGGNPAVSVEPGADVGIGGSGPVSSRLGGRTMRATSASFALRLAMEPMEIIGGSEGGGGRVAAALTTAGRVRKVDSRVTGRGCASTGTACTGTAGVTGTGVAMGPATVGTGVSAFASTGAGAIGSALRIGWSGSGFFGSM